MFITLPFNLVGVVILAFFASTLRTDSSYMYMVTVQQMLRFGRQGAPDIHLYSSGPQGLIQVFAENNVSNIM